MIGLQRGRDKISRGSSPRSLRARVCAAYESGISAPPGGGEPSNLVCGADAIKALWKCDVGRGFRKFGRLLPRCQCVRGAISSPDGRGLQRPADACGSSPRSYGWISRGKEGFVLGNCFDFIFARARGRGDLCGGGGRGQCQLRVTRSHRQKLYLFQVLEDFEWAMFFG